VRDRDAAGAPSDLVDRRSLSAEPPVRSADAAARFRLGHGGKRRAACARGA
jgi:hypothetical protein